MEFLYTVQASDMDADGISISANALTLNGGVIRGADRAQDAVLTHAAADDDPDHKVGWRRFLRAAGDEPRILIFSAKRRDLRARRDDQHVVGV